MWPRAVPAGDQDQQHGGMREGGREKGKEGGQL